MDDLPDLHEEPGRIIRNAVRCKLCRDVIESRHVHDFVWCSCFAVAVDGGREYLRRCWDGSLGTLHEVAEDLSEREGRD